MKDSHHAHTLVDVTVRLCFHVSFRVDVRSHTDTPAVLLTNEQPGLSDREKTGPTTGTYGPSERGTFPLANKRRK